jgi:hypothetical protein
MCSKNTTGKIQNLRAFYINTCHAFIIRSLLIKWTTSSTTNLEINFVRYQELGPIPVATRSKAHVCGRLVTGLAGSNPARGMDVCPLCLYVVLSCVGRGLCDGLITGPEESYRVSVCVWSRNPKKGGQRSVLAYKRLWMNESGIGTGQLVLWKAFRSLAKGQE